MTFIIKVRDDERHDVRQDKRGRHVPPIAAFSLCGAGLCEGGLYDGLREALYEGLYERLYEGLHEGLFLNLIYIYIYIYLYIYIYCIED